MAGYRRGPGHGQLVGLAVGLDWPGPSAGLPCDSSGLGPGYDFCAPCDRATDSTAKLISSFATSQPYVSAS